MTVADPHSLIGQTLAERYHVTDKLGEGGMGSVYKATDLKLQSDVVIKTPHAALIKDAEFAARFRREIRSLVQLSHANTVKVMDVGVHDGLPFAVMQYLPGGSLADLQRLYAPIEILEWLGDIADALDFMHQRGFIHRDVKPANILLDDLGRAYLADFGIAKVVEAGEAADQKGLTGTGIMVGTSVYMAPEMLMPDLYSDEYDERVDQYALAVTVFEMLIGRPPFTGDTLATVAVKLARTKAPLLHDLRPAIPEDMSQAVARGLLKKPDSRYPNCRAFAEAVYMAIGSDTGRTTVTGVRASTGTGRLSSPELKPLKAARVTAVLKTLKEERPGRRGRMTVDESSVDRRFTTKERNGGRSTAPSPMGERPDKMSAQRRRKPFQRNWLITGVVAFSVALGLMTASIMYYLIDADETLLSKPEVGGVVVSSQKDAKKNVVAVPVPADRATAMQTGRAGPPQPQTINKATLTFKGHTSWITSVAFSPDGRRIVSGSYDNTLKVWDAQGGEETFTLKGHTGLVRSVAFSPDGRRIVSGSLDNTLKVWDAQSGEETFTLKGHTSYVNSVAFSPDGRQIVSGSSDKTLMVWDVSKFVAKPQTRPQATSKPAPVETPEAPILVKNSIGMQLARISAGQFSKGSDRFARNKPKHSVRITKPFYLSVYEVTQQQYEKVMGVRPWQGKKEVQEGPDYPATYVSWEDAVKFCRKLSEKEGVEYRLPTEAQWEYACRAGTTTVYSFGDDESKLGQYVWYLKNAEGIGEKYAHRVGQKLPNPWGLYDMHGNVYEWCQDWRALYGYDRKVRIDPMGPAQGQKNSRVLRSGSWSGGQSNARSAMRYFGKPHIRNSRYGFRPALTYP